MRNMKLLQHFCGLVGKHTFTFEFRRQLRHAPGFGKTLIFEGLDLDVILCGLVIRAEAGLEPC